MKNVLIFILLGSMLSAQEYVMKINNSTILKNDFEKEHIKSLELFGVDETLKNNIDKELLILEAKKRKLENLPSVKKSFKAYFDENLEKALKIKDRKNELVNEAKKHIDKDLSVALIAIEVSPPYLKKDSLEAKNTLIKIKELYDKTKDITKTLKQINPKNVTIEPYEVSYLNAPYELENKVYKLNNLKESTEVFNLSNKYVFVILVKIIPQKGEYNLRQIVIPDTDSLNKTKIDKAYNELTESKISFDSIFKKYTKNTNLFEEGGYILKIKSGSIPQDVLENLEKTKIGGVSKPFKSPVGWHIFQLLKFMPINLLDKDFNEELNKRMDGDFVTAELENEIVKQAKKYFVVLTNLENITNFKLLAKKSYEVKDSIGLSLLKKTKNYFFYINKDSLASTRDIAIEWNKTVKSFNQKIPFEIQYNKFIINMFKAAYIDYAIDHVVDYNQEFKKEYNKYKDQVLYEKMIEQLVELSKDDTIVQAKYYTENKDKYKQPKRAEGVLYICENKEMEKIVLDVLNNKTKLDEVLEKYSGKVSHNQKIYLKTYVGEFNLNNPILPKGTKLKVGKQRITQNSYLYIVNFKNILEESTMSFENAKPLIKKDYVAYYIENKLNEFKQAANIEYNESVLSSLKKTYN